MSENYGIFREEAAKACSLGRQFLDAHAGKHHSKTPDGVTIYENFAQFLIYDVTKSMHLINIVDPPNPECALHRAHRFNFFQGEGQLTDRCFPDDLDTTSIALLTMPHLRDAGAYQGIMDEMLVYRNDNDVILVYHDHNRPRLEECVCINVLRFFYANGQGDRLKATEDHVFSVLDDHSLYNNGGRQYPTLEWMLYLLGRLMLEAPAVRQRFLDAYKRRLRQRLGRAETDPLALAMRILSCLFVGVAVSGKDVEALLALQSGETGVWPDGTAYRYGRTKVRIVNDGLTTALAVQALELLFSRGRSGG